MEEKRNESAITIGPVISITILAVFAMKPYIPKILPSGSYLQKFDSDLWIADDSTVLRGGINTRQEMLGDVIENILPGKSRNDVIRLLGLSSDDSHQPTLRFYLGPARADFSGLHIEFLQVHFDSSGHYEKSLVVLDD